MKQPGRAFHHFLELSPLGGAGSCCQTYDLHGLCWYSPQWRQGRALPCSRAVKWGTEKPPKKLRRRQGPLLPLRGCTLNHFARPVLPLMDDAEDITGDCFLGLAMCGINTLIVLGLFVVFG